MACCHLAPHAVQALADSEAKAAAAAKEAAALRAQVQAAEATAAAAAAEVATLKGVTEELKSLMAEAEKSFKSELTATASRGEAAVAALKQQHAEELQVCG